MGDLEFDFEQELNSRPPPSAASGAPGGEPTGKDRPRNYRQTVCTYWLRGLCMKGESCGFLHQFDPSRMPVCRNLLKTGVCKDIDCPYKHSIEEIKECNMYKLGLCIYGPACRFKHTRLNGPPPDPSTLEAAKPREYRNVNLVANQANEGIIQGPVHSMRRIRHGPGDRGRMLSLPSSRGDLDYPSRRRGDDGGSHNYRDRARSPPGRGGRPTAASSYGL